MNILALFLLGLIFTQVIFPLRTRRLKELSNEGNPIIDGRISYTADEVYRLIQSFDEEGRQLYAVTELTIDLVFPIIYALFFSLLMCFVFGRAFASTSDLQKMALLPFAILLADYGENASLVVVFLAFPNRFDAIVQLASLFTATKWILGGTTATHVIIGLVAWVGKLCQ